MKIVHAASEMFPFVKTGGLADVCGSLSKALAGFGHEVSFFLPGYRKLIESPEFEKAKLKLILKLELGEQFLRSEIWALPVGKRLTLYIVRRDEFFDRSNLYGSPERDYDDNDRRYIYFCKAIVEAMHLLEIKADILHCHDWQTAIAPLFLRLEEQRSGASLALKTFFSIHNLAFQGLFPRASFRYTNLAPEFNSVDGIEFYEQISLIKSGIVFADKIMTVSPNYAREILTPEFGCGLEGVLRMREEDLVGIANGIDTEIWDPSGDPLLPHAFSSKDLWGKRSCREALLQEVGLPPCEGPVFGLICRLTAQKGLDLLLRQIGFFAKHECRLIVLGKGAPEYESALKRWAKAHPEKIAVCIKLDEAMSHLVEAGSDFFLMPSIFEPCGLNQMYSQRYGSVPLVSRVGGLIDTVIDLASDPEKGTGIVFAPADAEFKAALAESLELFADKPRYAAVQQRCMARDFSWTGVARQYERLYTESI